MYEDNELDYNPEDVAWFLASEEDERTYLRMAMSSGMEDEEY